jgi:hypothetical protein
MNEYSIGVLDDGINGYFNNCVLVSIIGWRRSSTVTLVVRDERTFMAIVDPRRRLNNSGNRIRTRRLRRGDLWLCASVTLWPTAPFFTDTKITKRTQFKNRNHRSFPSAAKDDIIKFIKALNLTYYEYIQNPLQRYKQASNGKKIRSKIMQNA